MKKIKIPKVPKNERFLIGEGENEKQINKELIKEDIYIICMMTLIVIIIFIGIKFFKTQIL